MKEHVAVHLLELLSKKELRSSGMSLLYEILSPEKPYNHLAVSASDPVAYDQQ